MAKQPRATEPVAPAKAPFAIGDPNIIKHQPISWGLSAVDWGGEHGWRTLDLGEIEDLHDELSAFEGKTFYELERSSKIKDIPVEHFKNGPKKRLKSLGYEEVEVMWELRLKNKRRAWGMVEKAIFYFLWWDQKETVCNAPPKGERRR